MSKHPDKPHHPLPEDARARHDRLPESIDARDLGDDDPGAPPPSATEPPAERYRNPDGSTYET